MDYLKGMTGGDNQNQQGSTQGKVGTTDTTNQQGSSSGGGFLSGIGNKLNSAAGGGVESEKNEDMLDKGTLISLHFLLTTAPLCYFGNID